MSKNPSIPIEPEILDDRPSRGTMLPKILKLAASLPFADHVVAMWFALQDPQVPTSKKAIIMGALLYFISPVDLIPDFIPVIGKADDIAVITAAFKAVKDIITLDHLDHAERVLSKYKKI